MNEEEKYIEIITLDHIKKLGLEEPSLDFTSNVMTSILQKAEKKEKGWLSLYGWVALVVLPLIIFIIWYFLKIFKLTVDIHQTIMIFSPVVNSITNLFAGFKNFNISPVIFISFVAILLLLALAELIGRTKRA